MAEIELAVLLGEYAIGLGGLIYGLTHHKHGGGGSTTPQQSHAEDLPPDEDPGSGVAPDNPDDNTGGIVPGTAVPFAEHGVSHNTYQDLWYLEIHRHVGVLRRFLSKMRYYWPMMSLGTILALAKRYHISMTSQEARALKRAVIALREGRRLPAETPMAIRRLIATTSDPRLFWARRAYRSYKRMRENPYDSP